MKYTETDNNDTLSSEVHISFSMLDMVTVELDSDDKEFLNYCNKSDSIADKILGVERIARRLEQRHIEEKNKCQHLKSNENDKL